MRRSDYVTFILAAAAALLYIRHQRLDIEIARFDYMMRVMKEEEERGDR